METAKLAPVGADTLRMSDFYAQSSDGNPTVAAFTSSEALLDAIVQAVRRRISAAIKAEDLTACDADDLEISKRARASAAAGVSLPLIWLEERLQLTPTEQSALWTLLAHELDPDSRQRIRSLNSENSADPTVDALRRIVYRGRSQSYLELSAQGALQHLRLVTRTDGDHNAPLHRQTLAASQRLLALALGSSAIDPAVTDFAEPAQAGVALEALVTDPNAVMTLRRHLQNPSGPTLVVGTTGTGRRSLILALGHERAMQFLQIDARKLETDRVRLQAQLRDCAREAKLLGRYPLLCHLEALSEVTQRASDQTDAKPERIDLVEQEFTGAWFATSSKVLSRRWHRVPAVVELERLRGTQLASVWSTIVPEASPEDAEILAAMYPLAPALIVASGAAARRQAPDGNITADGIAAGVTTVLDDRLAGLATRRKVSQKPSDLVLPNDQASAIAELVARIRRRHIVLENWGFADKIGRSVGIAALFSGPPGTGKTMAAQIVAQELGLAIFQVDLSRVVSKWIGETERNLARLFDAAEASSAILLFDEADSLFGKRTDVKTSHDRYANQETNYLLQRLETFPGTCILTSNHESAIDPAFLRRLAIHVRFEIPELEERRKLWRAMLPAHAPIAEPLDLDSLAQTFEMSGGYIKNAVVRAAYLAADTTGVIDSQLLSHAAHLEYQAMGKIALAV